MGEANQITCPHCGQPYAVRPEQWAQYQGRTINCTKCGQPFVVAPPPGAQPPAPSAPPPYPAPQPPYAPSAATPPPYAATGGYPQPPAGYAPQYTAPQGYGYPPYPPSQPTSGWAVAGLVCGILGCVTFGLAGILGIIFSIVGLVKTRENRAGGRGMAIAGLVIGILSVLALVPAVTVLTPALSKAREAANRVKCAANMRQIGMAMQMYANSNQSQFPDTLQSLVKFDPTLAPSVFVCPASDKTPASASSLTADLAAGQHLSYVYLGKGLNVSSPATVVVLYEPLEDHRREGMNVLFADGHVEFLTRAAAQSILKQRAAGTFPVSYPAGTGGSGNSAPPPAPPGSDEDDGK